MVSPTTSQPESHVALAPVANVDLPKPPVKTTAPDHPSCSSSSSSSSSTTVEINGHVSENKLAAEISEKENEAENVTNGIIAEGNDSDEKDDDRKTCENYRDENDTKEDTGTNSEISHKNILIDSITSPKDNIPSTTSKSDSKLSSPISSPTFSSTSSSFNSASDQSSTTPNPTSPKNFTSAPIPTVNVWAMRKAAMNAKAKKEEKEKEKEKEKEREGKDKEGDGDHRKAGENIRKDGDRNGKENGIVNEFADETKRFPKKNSKKSKPAPILPPLEDQSSWPAPAEVLIKDKAKEASEQAEKKNDTGKKEEGSSPKRGKGKWIPIPATITHTTPLPTHHHGYKHRRRSEDTITLSHNRRDRYSQYDDVNGRDGREGRWDKEGKEGRGWDREGRRGRGGEGGESSGRESGRENGREGNSREGSGNGNGHGHGTTTGHRRRASVPPPASGQYGRRYMHNSDGNGQVSGHVNNNMYRGRRTGRGRSYGSRGPPRSASAIYSPGYPQTYSVFPNAKMPVVIDVDVLKYYIVQQVEYYFSIENLCKDIFLRNNMDFEGYVDVSLLAGFNRVKNLTTDEALVREALLYSHILEVNGDKVRKRDGWDFWLLPKQIQRAS